MGQRSVHAERFVLMDDKLTESIWPRNSRHGDVVKKHACALAE